MRKVCTLILIVSSLALLVIPHNIVIGKENEMNIIHSGSYGKGYRYNIQGWVYVHIEGEPYERGYQYGYLAAAEIVDMMKRWSDMAHNEKFMENFVIKRLTQNYDEFSETYWNLCKQRGIKFFWDQYPKEYQDEIKGIADGARARGGTIHGRLVDYKDVFTLNVIEETRETFNNPGGRGRPIESLINKIKGGIKYLLKGSEKEEDENFENCMIFIATGDATIDGRIVAAHATNPPSSNFMGQRTNMILDVQPTEGHRFVMTVFPGYIFSGENYQQNDCGIILMETVIWPPIGPWNVKGKIPLAVRVRKAIQYSDDIDDVIQYMMDGSNGLYPCDWVMADTKTGEIASLELGLYNHAITRTKNGFLWSCCNPKDDKVRWEQWSMFRFGILGRILFNKFRPSIIDKKFKELGNKYYGKIDVDIVKEIMATEPICIGNTDCKITDSKLMKNLGLWVYFGRSDGYHWKPGPKDVKKFKDAVENPGTGWLKIYASKSQPKNLPGNDAQNNAKKNSKIVWTYQTENTRNIDYSSSVISDDTIYAVSSSSILYALDANQGRLLWEQEIGEKTVTPSISKDFVFTGADKGVCAFDKKTGEIRWEQQIGCISCEPVIAKNLVISGCSNGGVFAFDIDSGKRVWNYKLPDLVTISKPCGNNIYIGSGSSLHAFDIVDEEIVWEFKTDGAIAKASAIDDKTVYLGSWDGNIYALDTNNGELKWKYQTGWGIDTTPAIDSNTLYVGSTDNNFYALNKETGELKWFYTCKAAIHSNPVVYGEYVFFGCDDGRLYAIDKTNGNLIWIFAPGYSISDGNVNNYITTPILSDPVAENGIIYIDVKGTIYALDAQTIETPKEIADGKTEGITPMVLFSLLALLGIALILFACFNKK